MSDKKGRVTAEVISREEIANQVFRLVIRQKEAAQSALPGQFVSLYCADKSRLLPRPISICDLDRESGDICLVFRIAGKGTEEFSRLEAGDTVDMIGPLGNGFPEDVPEMKTALLIGGGIGIPPMVLLGKALSSRGIRVIHADGYRDSDTFLTEELEASGGLYIATEDGSLGTKGNVLDAIRENGVSADVIFSCGPAPMLRAVKSYAKENGIRCFLSMEERMACGVGACLGCVCRTAETDGHSQVKNRRVCKDGPVFAAEDIEL